MKVNHKILVGLVGSLVAVGSADAQFQVSPAITPLNPIKLRSCDTVDFFQETGWLNQDHIGTSSADCLTGDFSSNASNSGATFNDNGNGFTSAQNGDRLSCYKGWETGASNYDDNTFGGETSTVWTWEVAAGNGGFTTVNNIQAEIGVVDDGPTNYEFHIWTGDGSAAGTSYEGLYGSGAFGTSASPLDTNLNIFLGNIPSVDVYSQNLNFSKILAAGESVFIEMYAYGQAGGISDTGQPGHGLALGDSSVRVCHNCVPEPSSALLGLIAGAGFLVRRRR